MIHRGSVPLLERNYSSQSNLPHVYFQHAISQGLLRFEQKEYLLWVTGTKVYLTAMLV